MLFRSGDVAANEGEAGRLRRVRADRREVRLGAGVGQLVQDGDPGAVAPRQHVPDVAGADEPGTAGHQKVRRSGLGAHRVGVGVLVAFGVAFDDGEGDEGVVKQGCSWSVSVPPVDGAHAAGAVSLVGSPPT